LRPFASWRGGLALDERNGLSRQTKGGEWSLGKARGVLLNVSFLTLAQVIDYIGRAATGIILARALGPQKFGLYAFAFSLTALVVGSSHFGLAPLAARAVAGAQGGRSRAKAEIAQILGTKLLLTFFALALLGFLLLVPSASKGEELPILALGLYWGMVSTSTIIHAIFLGLGRSEFVALSTGLRWIITLGVAILAFSFPKLMLVASGLLFAGTAELIASCAIAHLKGFPPEPALPPSLSKSLQEALPFALIAFGGLMPHFLRTAMGIRATASEVGFFAAAMNAASLVCIPAQSIRSVLFTAMSGEEKAYKALPTYTGASVGWGGLMGLLFYVLSPVIIPVLFGRNFLPSCPVAKILSSYIFAFHIVNPLQAALMAGRKEKEVALWSMMAIFLSVIVVLFLPSAKGGAIGATVGQIFLALALVGLKVSFSAHREQGGPF